MGDDDEKQGGDVDGEDGAQQSPGIKDIWFLIWFLNGSNFFLDFVLTNGLRFKTFQEPPPLQHYHPCRGSY